MGPGRKRSQTGCETCRARKVKCDERPNGCLNCQRLQLECLRRSASAPNQNVSDGNLVFTATPAAPNSLRRRRMIRSCKACRVSKLRCSGTPQCENCQRRGLSCQYEPGPEPGWVSRTKDARPQTMPPPGGRIQSCSPSCDTGDSTETSSRAGSKNANSSVMKSHWLFAKQLPSKSKVLQLVELYFKLVHPLRCFSFIHRPSFMQFIEDQSENERNSNMVLLAVCAIAAKFYAAERLDELGDGHVLGAGNEWAQMAHRHLYEAVQAPSTDMIMTAVLLHEHALRIGNYAAAFVITGLAVRLAQALRLNLEQQNTRGNSDAPPCAYESCRRLMWSVYIMDAWVGSGVDELTLLSDKNIKIELPVSEMDFVLENTKMPTGNPTSEEETRNLDLEAHFATLVGLRQRVLWIIKNLDSTQEPWLAQSEWSVIREELLRWNHGLPVNLGLTRSSIQKRKISGQHGALLHLHLTYHQTFYDLTRIGMPGLMRIKTPVVFPPEQGDFVRGLQDQCFEHGLAVSSIFDEALRHGMEAFADTWLCVVAHDVSRMLIHFLVNKFGSGFLRDEASMAREVEAAVRANAGALDRMIHIMALARPLLEAVIADLEMNGLEVPPDLAQKFHRADVRRRGSAVQLPSSSSQSNWGAGTLSQQGPENVLAPLAIFRMARKDIAENRVHGRPKDMSNPARLDKSPNETEVAAATAAQQQPFTWMQLTSQRPLTTSHTADAQSECMASLIEFNQLPMGFDDLQVYMTAPLMMDGYLERTMHGSTMDGGNSFATAHWPGWS